MPFDVARVRGLFPALGDGWVHLDAPAGMQIPEQVATAVATAMRAPVSRPGGLFPSSQRGAAIVDAADEVVLSRLDGKVNIAPWLRVAQQSGVTARWAEVDIETCVSAAPARMSAALGAMLAAAVGVGAVSSRW